MYKILVADEDSYNIPTIGRMAEKIAKNINSIEHTTSGGQTIQKIKEIQPDIVILDVKLSGMNGLEVVKRIRGFNKKVHIIITTAFDYFELAKEFISLNVDAFILKPIRNDELFQVLQNVFNKLNEEKIDNEKEYQKELNRAMGLKFTEYSLMYSLLFNGDYNNSLEIYSNLLGLESEGYIVDIEIVPQFIEKTKNVEKTSIMLYECIKHTLSKHYPCAVGPCIMNRVIAYVCDKKLEDIEKQKAKILNICNQIIKNLKDDLNMEAYIGVGGIYNIEQIYLSYEESIKCLRYKRDDKRESIHIADIEEKMTIVHESYIEMERLLVESVKTGQAESMDYFTSLLDMLKTLKIEDRKNKIIELIILACHSARMEGPKEGVFLNYMGYIEELKDVDELSLDAWAYRKFQYLIKTIRIRRTARVPYVIHNAIAYIEKHYTESISLEDIASHVGLTPQYFSTYFKEEMDCNLIDYITKLRIEKAKEIIRNSQMSVQEICFIVGYHDPNYFSRIFKKYVGITPSKYKKEFGDL